jgi:hypothetical protein
MVTRSNLGTEPDESDGRCGRSRPIRIERVSMAERARRALFSAGLASAGATAGGFWQPPTLDGGAPQSPADPPEPVRALGRRQTTASSSGSLRQDSRAADGSRISVQTPSPASASESIGWLRPPSTAACRKSASCRSAANEVADQRGIGPQTSGTHDSRRYFTCIRTTRPRRHEISHDVLMEGIARHVVRRRGRRDRRVHDLIHRVLGGIDPRAWIVASHRCLESPHRQINRNQMRGWE